MRKYERMMREKGAQFPPVLFSCSRILNFANPTTMEPGTGYEKVCILRLQINVFHEEKWKSSQKLELNGFVYFIVNEENCRERQNNSRSRKTERDVALNCTF